VNYDNIILTDSELIKGCLKKDSNCEKELFLRYASRMLGVCQRYARDAEDAEDILQDAFIKVFYKMQQFKQEGSFEGWIRRIVINTALKKYSLTRYHKETGISESTDVAENIREPNAFTNLSEKDILALINGLPDGYRVVFNLYVIEGFSHDEIAELLHIQAGTSRSQLVKARQLLQKQINDIQKIAV